MSKEEHRWEKEDKYLEEFDHPLWKRFQDQAAGSDTEAWTFIFRAFVEALKGAEPVIDVRSVSMSVISPLSENQFGWEVPLLKFLTSHVVNGKK